MSPETVMCTDGLWSQVDGLRLHRICQPFSLRLFSRHDEKGRELASGWTVGVFGEELPGAKPMDALISVVRDDELMSLRKFRKALKRLQERGFDYDRLCPGGAEDLLDYFKRSITRAQ